MSPSFSLKPTFWLPPGRVCVCVLLIALVVYNPFAALGGSSGRLSYETLARNRASIGSGELQHFSPVSNPDVQMELDVDLRGMGPAVPIQQEQPTRDRHHAELPSQPALLSAVWFRPPPSL